MKWPIVQKFYEYEDYPFEALDDDVVKIFESAKLGLAEIRRTKYNRLLKLLECYLQITEQTLHLGDLSRQKTSSILQTFVGALYSSKFAALTPSNVYDYSLALVALMHEVKKTIADAIDVDVELSVGGPTVTADRLRRDFEGICLNTEKIWLWSAWPSTNRNGKITYFPLYPLYARLGRGFTQQFFEHCDSYFSARKADKINCLTSFCKFIGEYPEEITPQSLKDQSFIGEFWRKFFVHYMVTGHGSGSQMSTLVTQWRSFVATIVEPYFIGSGQFARPWGELPSPTPVKASGAKTHLKTTAEGHVIKTKLLTDVPLHVTDKVAMELLFKSIRADIELFKKWAQLEVEEMWSRYNRVQKSSINGKVIHINKRRGICSDVEYNYWLKDKSNPEFFCNIAASFKHYGFKTGKDFQLSLVYPRPLPQIAYELALPIASSLLPHCILLVANHPEITPSFLEKIQLFDKNGKQTGFVETDGGYKLISHKDRRGSNKAHQIVSLTPETAEIVRQVIALTAPIREYMKNGKDDGYRYLFIACKGGFGTPCRITKFASYTSGPKMVRLIAEGIGKTSDLSYDERLAKASNFSLPSLRASAGVLVYLETQSVEKMAKALGHAQYDHRLIESYLPTPLRVFFQERWVRIFQETFIIEALKDSEFLLEASSFSSIDELDEFMRHHALKLIHKEIYEEFTEADSIGHKSEIVFGLNTSILTILLSLLAAVESASQEVSATARYWAGITKKLVEVVDSPNFQRFDLKSYLQQARAKANPQMLGSIIYAS